MAKRKENEKEEIMSHTEFRDTIDGRTEDLTGNWWPFVENVNDILDRMVQLEQKMDDYDNRIGEAYGLGRTISKSLHKLGFYDKDLRLIWKSVKLMNGVLEDAEKARTDDE
jgi:hypothetical protein